MDPKKLYKYLQSNKLAGGPISVTESSRIEQRIIDSFSDPKSFLYELIQNADDAAINGNVTIKVIATNDYIYLAHTGSPFTQEDVMALCTTGALRKDQKSKSQDKSKIGYKGVGFKSVFKISDEVTIFSGKYQFQFNQKYWETKGINTSKELGWNDECFRKWEEHCEYGQLVNKIEFPWRTIPIAVLEEVPEGFEDFTVITRIKLNDYIRKVDFEGELNTLLANSNLILFLNSNNITIKAEDRTLSKELNNNVITITNGSNKEEWRLFSSNIEVSKEDLPPNAPPKMEELNEIGITIAINLKDGVVGPLKKQPCDTFSFLPTKESFGLPFLVNSQFILDNSREHLATNDKWNERIFEAFGLLLASSLEELSKEEDSKTHVFSLIPSNKELNKYQEALYDNLESQLKHITFIPVFDSDEPKSIDEVIIDKTGLSEVPELRPLVKKLLSADGKYIVDSTNLKGLSKLNYFEIECLDKNNIKSCFEQDNIQEYLREKNNSYFTELIEGFKGSGLEINLIKEIPFLKTDENEIETPNKLYFFKSGDTIIKELAFSFLSPHISDSLKYQTKRWIKDELGIKEASPSSVTLKSEKYKYSLRSKEKNIAFYRYLFKNRHEIKNWNFIKEIPMLTTDDNIEKQENLYLSDCYKPIDEIETLLNEDIFVSEEYCQLPKEYEDWGIFLHQSIGISNEIKFSTTQLISNGHVPSIDYYLTRYALENKSLQSYFDYAQECYDINEQIINENFKTYGSDKTRDHICNLKSIKLFQFLSQSNDDFCNYFWKKTFKQIAKEPSLFTELVTSKIGTPTFDWYRAGSNRFSLENFNVWVIKNEKVFPSTKGRVLQAEEILLPTDQNLLFKDFLDILALDIPENIKNIELKGEKLFKFRETPTDEEVIGILSSLKSDSKNVKTLVEKIYKYLLKSSKDFVIKEVPKLLTQGDEFVPREDIVYIQDRTLRKKLNLDNHLYIPRGITDEADEIKLAKILGVDKISTDTIKSSEARKDENFSTYIKEKERLFRCIITEEVELSNINNLEVIAHNGIEFEIKGQLQPINALIIPSSEKEATLHIDHNWKNKRTITREISEEINKYLHIDNLLLVDDILWTCPLKVIESMENDGYEVSDDVKDYYQNLQSKKSLLPIQKTSFISDSDHESSANDLSSSNIETINQLTLEIVRLKKIIDDYNQTSGNATSSPTVSQDDVYHEEIKKKSELFLYNELRRKYPDYRINWLNQNAAGDFAESWSDHDFEVIDESTNVYHYIDCKGTPYAKRTFYLTKNEWEFFLNCVESNKSYQIYRVFNVESKMELIFIDSLWEWIQNGKVVPYLLATEKIKGSRVFLTLNPERVQILNKQPCPSTN